VKKDNPNLDAIFIKREERPLSSISIRLIKKKIRNGFIGYQEIKLRKDVECTKDFVLV
jgi:hypothetical protein